MNSGREEFAAALDVSHETLEKFDCYANELAKWQSRHNLIGPGTLPQIWVRHFWDCGQLAAIYSQRPAVKPSPTWADIGSGAGFPGLVVSLLTGWPVYLIEKNRKKCAFLRHMIRATGASATVQEARAEDIPGVGADVVTSRALAPVSRLLPVSLRHLKKDGEIWLLKGQDVDQELTETAISWNMQVERIASQTDRAGQILIMKDISRVET